MLSTLARSPGRVFTRSQLLDALHGVAFKSYERAIDAHIKNLRHKVERDPAQPAYILTVYGVGYKFNDRLAFGPAKSCRDVRAQPTAPPPPLVA